ncbi:MAG: biotin transporter BioY [Candidatus Omnitrophica bacterium]|nr:biotin transporter BioY [Candidatus Omnitrophota bacterium]
MQKQLSWNVLGKDILTDGLMRRGVGILAFLILTIEGAFLYIPLPGTPVPITLQTFFVLLCAAFLRRKDGFLTQGAYIGLGALGLPVLSQATGGILRLFGPTGGYLAGFAVCIYVVSALLDYFKNKNQLTFLKILFTFASGIAAIYLCGGLWLAFITKFSISEVITCGIMPFIAGDALKVIFAAIIFHKSNSRMKNLFKA